MQAGIYKHYKGGLYQVLGVGQHTETNEIVVIYIPLQHDPSHTGPRLRVRPASGPNGFCTDVTTDSGTSLCKCTQARFQYIGTGE